MKTFFNLIQDVQKPGLCHRCGGCVTFCSAINYGALEIDADGKPGYGDIEKCIECGLCHAICPEIGELEQEVRRRASWSEPIGRVIETAIAQSSDPAILDRATDGGVITAILLHLLERGRIDGAIVTKQVGPFQRAPYLATTREEIIDAAGFFFDISHGMPEFGEHYMTSASIAEFDPMIKKRLNRVALVGTPCQIQSVRRMQAMDLIPSDSIKFCLGLFCSGNFMFGDSQRAMLADMGGFSWENVSKVNIKENLQLHLNSGEKKTIELEDLYTIRRHACRFCGDYAAEFADISFGGIGAAEGWTTVMTRTPLGRAALADAVSAGAIVKSAYEDDTNISTDAHKKVQAWSENKKASAYRQLCSLEKKPVVIRD
jgi:coenzyme F420 hydrogenase subunit beta